MESSNFFQRGVVCVKSESLPIRNLIKILKANRIFKTITNLVQKFSTLQRSKCFISEEGYQNSLIQLR